VYGTVATVPYKYAEEADDAANKVSQRKRIGINYQAQKKGSTATPRISCAVNYPENLQSVLNHAPNSEITLFKTLIKVAFSSRFPTVTRMQFVIRGGLFRFFT